MTIAPVLGLLLLAAPVQSLSGDAVRQYEDAVRLVQAARYPEALAALNALAARFPRVPEVFATRCSAQLGNGAAAGAEADCRYALTLKPDLSMGVYGLAVAEDNQGKSAEAVAHYRDYAARRDAEPSLKAQSLARADALAAPRQLTVAAPPPPAAAAPVAVSQPAGPRGTLYIYRNHYFQSGDQQVTLLVDDQVVGDIAHDQYVEVQLPAGDHVVEACVGGLRYRHHRGFPTLSINTSNGNIDARVGTTGESSDRIRGITVPVEVAPNGQTYVNFDHTGGRLYLAQQPAQQGYSEVRSDCRKAYTKRL